jgi:nucleotide-binding universal stress UspA family protein
MEKQNLIKKILVALDGSQPANRAFDFALDLAEKYSAKILLLSVIPPIKMPTAVYTASGMQPLAPIAMDKYLEESQARHKKMLSEALKKAKKTKPKSKVSTKLAEGRPPDEIVKTAKEGNYDIIVIGSRGLGGIKEFLLGSVSDRVADEAACPVLIVK